jgi:hypothetical protein
MSIEQIKEQLCVIGVIILVTAPFAWMWVSGIDNMKKNHPDYKGDDFLNWDGTNPWE